MGEFNSVSVPMSDATPHDQAAEKAAPVTPAAERPAWLPAKFGTPEDMAKAYGELERKQSASPTPPAPAPTKPNLPPAAPPVTPPLTPPVAGITAEAMAGYAEQYATNGGKLPDATYAELAAKGVDKTAVDGYIAGQIALQKAAFESIAAHAGGVEQYATLAQWGANNLSPAEVQAYDTAVTSGDPAKAELAVKGLQARFEAANGNAPAPIMGTPAPASSAVAPYQSVAQLTEDMASKKYKNDPAFRSQVEARIAASSIF